MESHGRNRFLVRVGLAAALCSLGAVGMSIKTAQVVALARSGVVSPLDIAFWAFGLMVAVVAAMSCFAAMAIPLRR